MKQNIDLDDFDPIRSLVKGNQKNPNDFNLDINENEYSDRENSEESFQTNLNSYNRQFQEYHNDNQPFIINFT